MRRVTDAKRKSQLVQKGADSLSSAKSTLASTDSFQAISKNLQANAKLNALDFLSQGQSVMDEVLRQKKAAASGSPKARLQQKFQAIWEKVRSAPLCSPQKHHSGKLGSPTGGYEW
eukprot:COSAG04_NODE_15197_length_540_cov_0.693878_2_plen_116_part_00